VPVFRLSRKATTSAFMNTIPPQPALPLALPRDHRVNCQHAL